MSSSTAYHSDKFLPADHPVPSHSPLQQKVREIISHAWGFSHVIQYNPSANPISLEKQYLPQLESHLSEYVIAEKSDGIRYLVVLGSLDGRGFCVLVNRKMQMFEVPVFANSEYFKGSVFDGEMVVETLPASQHRQKLLIFDLVSVRGETRRSADLIQRYNEYLKIFDLEGNDILDHDMTQWESLAFELADTKDKIVCLGNKTALQFYPKPFVQLLHVGSMWRSMPKLKHHSDGLIITRITAPVGTGTDHNILKWKEHHTIDLIFKSNFNKGKWVHKLYFQDHENLVNSLDRTFEVKGRIFHLQAQDSAVLTSTCRYFAETHKAQFSLLGECTCTFDSEQPIIWCSVSKWRRDKHTPNNITVIQRTLVNIVENVTIEELIQLSNKHLYK